ncbi:MAG: TonB family protein [Gammaproteobacteria bacterium]|nr:TonB family protein [Gammaproteobacteria bacterium]
MMHKKQASILPVYTLSRSVGYRHWLCALLLASSLLLILLPQTEPKQVSIKQQGQEQSIILSLSKIHAPVSHPLPVVVPTKKTVAAKPVEKKAIQKVVAKKLPTVKKARVKARLVPKPKSDAVKAEALEKEKTEETEEKVAQSASAAAQSSQSASQIEAIRNAYLRELSLWLNKHKRYPASARRRAQEGDVTLGFVITAQGQLISHQLLSPAVYQSLNKEALTMIQRASPFPPVPLEIRDTATEFEYSIPIRFSLQ